MSSTRVPISIPGRPFGIYPPNNMMNPDGFFLTILDDHFIDVHITNESSEELKNVRVYIEGVSDPGIILVPNVLWMGNIPSNAAFPVRFEASFSAASPGISFISFIVESDDFTFKRVIKKIFVASIDYEPVSKTFIVQAPEGEMRIRIHDAIIGPKDKFCEDRRPYLVLPTDLEYVWVPHPPYRGVHGPFLYEDPWWKVLLFLAAAVAAYFSVKTSTKKDEERVMGGTTFDETGTSGTYCCTRVETSTTMGKSSGSGYLAAGLAVASVVLAYAAYASDGPDLHYRGQTATPPAEGEFTISEAVRAQIKYPIAPSPGKYFPIEGKWEYTRVTNANTYRFSDYDKRENPHYLKSYEVEAPSIYDRLTGPLKVRARFQKIDGSYYKGGQLYVMGVLASTDGRTRFFQLNDAAILLDDKENDGWYTGGYEFREELRFLDIDKGSDLVGDWYLFVLAQVVNTNKEGTLPTDEEHMIGGFLLTSQLQLNFNKPCQLKHDAVIHIV